MCSWYQLLLHLKYEMTRTNCTFFFLLVWQPVYWHRSKCSLKLLWAATSISKNLPIAQQICGICFKWLSEILWAIEAALFTLPATIKMNLGSCKNYLSQWMEICHPQAHSEECTIASKACQRTGAVVFRSTWLLGIITPHSTFEAWIKIQIPTDKERHSS